MSIDSYELMFENITKIKITCRGQNCPEFGDQLNGEVNVVFDILEPQSPYSLKRIAHVGSVNIYGQDCSKSEKVGLPGSSDKANNRICKAEAVNL